jgi:hypothetical protein
MSKSGKYSPRTFTVPLFGAFFRVHSWWTFREVYHAPEVWPWWKLFSVSLLTLVNQPGTKVWRLWVYFRWNVRPRSDPYPFKVAGPRGTSAAWSCDFDYCLR